MGGNEFRHLFHNVLRLSGSFPGSLGRSSTGRLSGTGCRSRSIPGAFPGFCSRILLLDRLFLTPAGEGIGCRIPRSVCRRLRSLRSRIGRFHADVVVTVLVNF